MTDYVLSGLVKRRAELAGEAAALRTHLAQIGTDMGHLDAVIRQFDSEYDSARIRPKRPRGPDVAGRGELSRFVLGVLREAPEPMTTAAIAERLIVARGMDGHDRRVVARTKKHVGMTLGRQKKRGVVRSDQGPGQFVLWEVAR